MKFYLLISMVLFLNSILFADERETEVTCSRLLSGNLFDTSNVESLRSKIIKKSKKEEGKTETAEIIWLDGWESLPRTKDISVMGARFVLEKKLFSYDVNNYHRDEFILFIKNRIPEWGELMSQFPDSLLYLNYVQISIENALTIADIQTPEFINKPEYPIFLHLEDSIFEAFKKLEVYESVLNASKEKVYDQNKKIELAENSIAPFYKIFEKFTFYATFSVFETVRVGLEKAGVRSVDTLKLAIYFSKIPTSNILREIEPRVRQIAMSAKKASKMASLDGLVQIKTLIDELNREFAQTFGPISNSELKWAQKVISEFSSHAIVKYDPDIGLESIVKGEIPIMPNL